MALKMTLKFHGNTKTIPATDEAAVAEQPTQLDAASLLMNAKTYIIADKYLIHSLKERAVTKYKEVLTTTWNSTSFIESARLIFENTPESDRMLREVTIRKASEDTRALFDRGEFVALLKDRSDFAADILRDIVFNPHNGAQEADPDDWGFGATKKSKEKGLF